MHVALVKGADMHVDSGVHAGRQSLNSVVQTQQLKSFVRARECCSALEKGVERGWRQMARTACLWVNRDLRSM